MRLIDLVLREILVRESGSTAGTSFFVESPRYSPNQSSSEGAEIEEEDSFGLDCIDCLLGEELSD